METLLRSLFLLCFFKLAVFSESPCVIELECAECIPENMPIVTSHRAANGTVRVASGEEVSLACFGGAFTAYPARGSLLAACEAGRYRVRHDGALRHLLELDCQESVFEDVLHHVDYCGAPLQGRSYQMREEGGRGPKHLATLCFDEDRALAVRAHLSNAPDNRLRLAPHHDSAGPLSLLGNFNHMFDAKTRTDADKLYSDDVRMTRKLHELFKYERFTFADQTLTSSKLLSGHYFDDQNMRVTDFVSNRVAVWSGVARGNLQHLHRDVAKFLKMMRPHASVDVYAGTHDVLSLRSGSSRSEIYLKPGRFPVPKYLWTVVHDKQNKKASAIILTNDPFIAVSEIRETVFCESACSKVSWLHELRRNRNYESPVYGLVFCCDVHNFTNVVTEMPKEILTDIPAGDVGMLTETFL